MSKQKQTFNQTLLKFNEIVRGYIESKFFMKEDLLAPLNAFRHLHRDALFALLEESGTIQFLKTATDSRAQLEDRTSSISINEDGTVQVQTKSGDDLRISVPSFRDIVSQNVVGKESESYWLAVVYLYMNGEEQIMAYMAKRKIEDGLI